ncbi:Vph1 [Kluyveromyces lactis]|nr:Vph1 [Kluyveromyces lactis]
MSESVEKQEAVFRSAEMSLVEMYIPQEISRDAVYSLGHTGLVQFRDLNRKVKSFQRTFVSDIRRLDNVERQYRYLVSLLQKFDIPLYQEPLSEEVSASPVPPSTSVIADHVENASILETRMQQLVESSDGLETKKTDLEQFRAALLAADKFFTGESDFSTLNHPPTQDELLELGEGQNLTHRACFVAGVIPRTKVGTLEQILWRAVRGNLYFKHLELDEPFYDPKSKEKVFKNAFIVFSHGDMIIQRIQKIAESLDASIYDVNESSDLRSNQLKETNSRLQDIYTVLDSTNTTLESELFAISKELDGWYRDISHEKAMYEVLNLFAYDSSRKILTAEGWCPTDELTVVQNKLKETCVRLGIASPAIVNVIETSRTPPTFHRTNKFTQAFQDICDCYGIAAYQEANPGLATIVTFPFMFAIMFGDMGHGALMAMAAAVLVLNEKKIGNMKRDEIFDMAYSGRYIVLFMGLFSVYTGFIYNDMFSKSLTLFKSGWKYPESWEVGESITAHQVGVYAFGIDSAWHGTENALLFANSLKMKLSIIMGFIHMFYSYMYSLANDFYFNDMVNIYCNFIPGLLFLSSIFGYLVICIIYKWSVDWVADGKPAPGLLNMLINMFLSPGTIEDELYPGQAKVQVFLLLLALVCIPWLLLAKPLHFKYTQDKHQHQPIALSEDDQVPNSGQVEEYDNEQIEDEDDDEEAGHGENMGDVVIHQVIHTIEWCLNCVSHTASYLRLWALSLAHAQLSTVLWTMTIEIAFGMSGFVGVVMTVALFAMWFVLTCVILVVMEGTSAMLHSLRLHWVESMSKFFKGEGIPYEPFKFVHLELEPEVSS